MRNFEDIKMALEAIETSLSSIDPKDITDLGGFLTISNDIAVMLATLSTITRKVPEPYGYTGGQIGFKDVDNNPFLIALHNEVGPRDFTHRIFKTVNIEKAREVLNKEIHFKYEDIKIKDILDVVFDMLRHMNGNDAWWRE